MRKESPKSPKIHKSKLTGFLTPARNVWDFPALTSSPRGTQGAKASSRGRHPAAEDDAAAADAAATESLD